MDNISTYLEELYLREDLSQLQESVIGDIISKFTPESKTKDLVNKMKGSVDIKDPVKSISKIKKITNSIPKPSAEAINSYLDKKIPGFTGMKKTAQTIIKNSLPKVSDEMTEAAASFLVASSFIAKKEENKDSKTLLKVNIKNFVNKVRSFADSYYEEEEKKGKTKGLIFEHIYDLAVGFVIVVSVLAIVGGILGGGYIVLSAIAAHMSGIIFAIILVLIMIIAIAILKLQG